MSITINGDGNTVITVGDVNIAIPSDGGACVSADMMVPKKDSDGRVKDVRVKDLSNGDLIRGIQITDSMHEASWCKVEAVFPSAGGQNKTTHDGFTEDHMVLGLYNVHPYGKRGDVKNGPVYTLATDCDAMVNNYGKAFTPISTAFCPRSVLSLSEYFTLMQAIRGVFNRTGYFWFDTSAYHDNKTAKVPSWLEQLPQICQQLLQCTRQGECQEFETVMEEFVHSHVNRRYATIVEREFPNLGGDVSKQQAGTITEAVRSQNGGSHLIVFATLGSVMVLLMIFAVGVLIYRTRVMKKKAEKEPPFESGQNHPQA